jgi:hypothetical protein
MDPILKEGAQRVLNYFLRGGHLGDGDKDDLTHISLEEFKSAKGFSEAGDVFIDSLLKDKTNYRMLSRLQNEGLFNDIEVSLRDFHALMRGTGYKGESISPKLAKLNRSIERGVGEGYAKLMAGYIVENGFKCFSKAAHILRIEVVDFKLRGVGPYTLRSEIKTYDRILVEKAQYDKLKKGDKVPNKVVERRAPWIKGDEYRLIKKSESICYFYKDLDGSLVEISKDIYSLVVSGKLS